jgi:hypothetical protein
VKKFTNFITIYIVDLTIFNWHCMSNKNKVCDTNRKFYDAVWIWNDLCNGLNIIYMRYYKVNFVNVNQNTKDLIQKKI